MGLLVGLPLKLFHIAFVLLRFLWPVLLLLLARWILRRLRQRGSDQSGGQQTQYTAHKQKKPDFDGPVVDVDYRVVDEPEEPK